MPNETLITDLVAQEAMQQLEELDRAMEGTLQQFQNCARELAQGLKVPVEVTGDVDALRTLTNTVMRDAQQATQQLTQQLQQQQQVVANTTNTISRQLQAQENLNKAQREAFTQDQQAQDLAKALLGTRQQNYELLARYTAEMKANKDAQKRVNEQEKQGLITAEQAIQKRATLMAAYDKTKFAAQELTKILAAENKEANAVQGSYQQLSQKLERLKMAYKQMNDAQKASAGGKELEKEIQNLDAHLKDLAADMGEHQRNVGNYAIASQSLKSELKDLTNEIAQLTMEYNHLSSEEQRSDVGIALREKIGELTEKAGEYRDIIADVKQSINASASDTRWFDTMAESGQLMISTFQLAQSSCEALGLSEKSLQQSMLGVQRAMQAVQALQVIQNTLQKQSNLMKGIGILQTKALAAATALETKARTQETGATIAQTVAMKAFNAVAKANPYVLLATAILTVVGLIIGYTQATKEATQADEEAAAAAKLHQESVESMSQTYANNVAEPLVQLKLLRDQWNALGDDLAAKRKFVVQHQKDLESVASAAGIAKTEVSNVNGVERVLVTATASVTTAIKRRAEGMAAYAEMIRLAQLRTQEIDKIWANAKFATAKAGHRIATSHTTGDITKAMAQNGYSAEEIRAIGNNYTTDKGFSEYSFTLTQKGADIINKMRYKQVQDAAMKQTRETEAKFNKEIDRLAERAVANLSYSAEGFTPATATTPSGGRKKGGTTSSTSKAGRGGTTRTTAEKKQQAKDEEELQKILLDIFIDTNNKKSKVVEEYSQEWKDIMIQAITEQRDKDLSENKDKYKQYMKDLKDSLAQGKITEDQYRQLSAEAQLVYTERGKAIQKAAADEVKKLDDDIQKHKEEVAHKELELRQEKYEKEIEEVNAQGQMLLDAETRRYLGELNAAKGNAEAIERIRKEHAERVADITERNAIAVAQKTVETLEAELAEENLSAEDRKEINEQLAKAKQGLTQATLDHTEASLDREVEAEQEAADKREEQREKEKELVKKWIDEIANSLSTIADLMGSIYDGQIAKIEEAMEKNTEWHDQQIAHIDSLAEHDIITSEEAELRKREAEAATAKRQEELEKKKASLEYKKAIVEKANSVAQAIIATSLAVTEALPNIPLSILVGALGAAQVATILAQPIKAYAEGTKGKPHPGGLAVVGDAGRAELVMFGHRAWVTPDTPTVVDLPKGAEVLPDVSKADIIQKGADLAVSLPRGKGGNSPVIINDYQALESRMANNTKAVTSELRAVRGTIRREMKRQKFNAYIAQRI